MASACVRSVVVLLATLSAAVVEAATTTFSPSCLATGITTFPGCTAFLNSNDVCATAQNQAAKQTCLCNQRYLDAAFG